jgi:Tol biopolymer transport system component
MPIGRCSLAGLALAVAVLAAAAGASGEIPNGRIVFVRFVPSEQYDLFKIRGDGTGLVRLTHSRPYDEEPRWSPDGRRMLALADGRLVLRSVNGRLLRRLPAAGFEAHWSPDGRLIAYLVGRCPDPTGKGDDSCADLWVIRPDGSGRRRLAAEGVDLTVVRRPYAWAPDGRRIVYTRYAAPGGLAIVSARDARTRNLRGTAPGGDPDWSPDGRWIAFSRQRGPFLGSDLFRVAPAGTGLQRIARGGRDVSRGTWSPDSSHIAYFRDIARVEGGESWAVVVADPDGARPRRLAVASDNSVLLWSPDSSRVLWSTFFNRLMVAPADSRGRPTLLTTGETPDWG